MPTSKYTLWLNVRDTLLPWLSTAPSVYDSLGATLTYGASLSFTK